MSNHPVVRAIFFDFDGVLVDSVPLKERVFREMIREQAPEHVEPAMEYYLSHGGTSRVEKFRAIWPNILHRHLPDDVLSRLAKEFSHRVSGRVIRCPYIRGAEAFLRKFHEDLQLFVISGTPEPELQRIVRSRGMQPFFQGVFGSPPTKVDIGERILREWQLQRSEVCFIGDATTDRDAARKLQTRFVGISGPHLDPFLDGDETTIADLMELEALLFHDR